jgi:hypothetical protein
VWLSDGVALHDRLGPGYTLLRLSGTKADTGHLERLFHEACAPLEVLDISNQRVREIYEFDLLLVRPDLHIAWRGNQFSGADATKIAATAIGRHNTASSRGT